jgi:hypothetical protein
MSWQFWEGRIRASSASSVLSVSKLRHLQTCSSTHAWNRGFDRAVIMPRFSQARTNRDLRSIPSVDGWLSSTDKRKHDLLTTWPTRCLLLHLPHAAPLAPGFSPVSPRRSIPYSGRLQTSDEETEAQSNGSRETIRFRQTSRVHQHWLACFYKRLKSSTYRANAVSDEQLP